MRGDRTVADLAAQYEIHPNQVQAWKKQLVDSAEAVFGRGPSPSSDPEGQVKDLHAKIGELAMEKDFLSKALGRDQ
jgi:transposase-like protein